MNGSAGDFSSNYYSGSAGDFRLNYYSSTSGNAVHNWSKWQQPQEIITREKFLEAWQQFRFENPDWLNILTNPPTLEPKVIARERKPLRKIQLRKEGDA